MTAPKNADGQSFPVTYLSTEVSDRLTQEILDAFNRERLTPQRARVVLIRVRTLIDMDELIARTGSH
ncbi:MAG: hypothetical protein LZF62_380009 [Nitrospira sp.]|nr:MAG: hypothetical protein LZF62_380009 [Nitrospira sp.]